MFTDMATANPVIFVNHVTSLKNLAERQPVYIHQVVPIIGAVGTVNQVRIHTEIFHFYNKKIAVHCIGIFCNLSLRL